MRMYGVRREAVTLVPGGVDHRRFVSPTAAKSDLRRRLRLPADGPMIITVRRLAARMGLDNLIAAMPAVLQALPAEVHLVVVGQGQLREHLERRVSALGLGGHVHFVGFVSDKALPLYYQAADLFVLPSRSLEGFGLITLEAFSSGLPVVGTPTGATPELLAQVDERLILQGTSPDAIAAGIVRYFTQVKGCIAPGTLRELVLSRYTWETVVAQTEAVYARLLHGTSTAPVRLAGKQG
jgi:glycosyltransferase involved in cell wall biosynthesis